MMYPVNAFDDMNGNQLFESMTGITIVPEPNLDSLMDQGRIDPFEAEGWSMGDCMEALVLRVIKVNKPRVLRNGKPTLKFIPSTRREMLATVDAPEECRFESDDISKIATVSREDAPPHIHGRRCNWTRWLRIGYDRNNTNDSLYMFVFYENWVDSALYAGNVTDRDIADAIAYFLKQTGGNVTFDVEPGITDKIAAFVERRGMFNSPDPEEVREKKTIRNRAKRERRKERKRELALEKAEEEVECERQRKQKDDGIEGIHKGKKGFQQLAEEEAERRRKELAEAHRKWEALHPKQERIVVRGESHKEKPKAPKPEPTMEEKLQRMDFEEKRGDRQLVFEDKQKQEQQAALERRNAAKKAEEKDAMKEAGMRIAQAANPKAPPLTLARAAGI